MSDNDKVTNKEINEENSVNTNDKVDPAISTPTTSATEPKVFVPSTNAVELVGTVVSSPVYSHDYNDESFYSVLIRVVRNYNKSNGRYDDIHVFMPKKYVVNNGNIVDIGSRLSIKGYIVQSKLHNLFDISVVAASVSSVDQSVADQNKLRLSGSIYKLFEDYNITGTTYVIKSLIVKQFLDALNKDYLTVKLSAWNTTVRYINREFKEGDEVIIAGQIISKEVHKKSDNEVNNITLHEGIISVIEHKDTKSE